MRGKNPLRPPVSGSGERLEVKNIFATLQGEGPFTGWPAVFIRLGGCNLACKFCDTDFEEFRTMSLEHIMDQVLSKAENDKGERLRDLVVITGGEPMRQPIELLCDELVAQGFKVQIETNGTLYRFLHEEVDIICSPKNQGKGYHPIRPDLLDQITAFKFIISASDPAYNHVADVGQAMRGIPVYVQPMDEYDPEKNAKNLAYTVDLAMREGYRLSIQTHKIAGIE